MTVGSRLIIPNADPVYQSPGVPSVGATLVIYNTGTTTPATIYADQGLTTPILNPQTSDSGGNFYAQSTGIFADSSVAYDAVLSCPNGTIVSYSTLWGVAPASSISGFAPINSPAFTGNPTAPTPSVADNSSSIATTAWVNNYFNNVVGSSITSGAIWAFAMSAVPSGWLVCDGTAVSRSTYARLFAAIGTVWGSGDGTSTFNLPDFRGQFLRGLDTGGAIDPGRGFASVQGYAMQYHKHTWGTSQNTYSGYIGVATTYASGGDDNVKDYQSLPSPNNAFTGNAATDVGTVSSASETRPTNVAIIFCVKV